MVKIFIDPGHGGNDPGASGYGLKEKDLTLKISKRIQEILKGYDVKVKMSRTTDKSLSLKQRTDAANEWGADYVLSVHINSGGGTGFESFVFNGRLYEKTKDLRDIIHDEIIKAAYSGFRDRGKKKQNFHMVREPDASAMLTENLFIDTKKDADKLKSTSFLNKVAQGHADGLIKAFGLNKKTSKPEPNKPSKPKKKSKQRGVATVIVPSLNLRDKPTTKGKLIRKLSKGESYKVWEEKNGWLRLGNDMWASWQNGVYMNWTEKPNKKKSKTKPKTLKVGSKVKIKSSAGKYSRSNVSIPAGKKNKTMTVQQIGKDDVLLEEVYSWVKKSDLA